VIEGLVSENDDLKRLNRHAVESVESWKEECIKADSRLAALKYEVGALEALEAETREYVHAHRNINDLWFIDELNWLDRVRGKS
jgi:hypothetical protein